jgi:hypothetical protein
MKVGSDFYLIGDLRLRCAGPTYNTASAFNILFVLVFVVGWPAFLVWCGFVVFAYGEYVIIYNSFIVILFRYLRQIRDQNKLSEERVLIRVGFLFSQYREEYLYVSFHACVLVT